MTVTEWQGDFGGWCWDSLLSGKSDVELVLIVLELFTCREQWWEMILIVLGLFTAEKSDGELVLILLEQFTCREQ